MVIIANMSYPTESAGEMPKRFMEQPPLPAYITMKGPYGIFEVGAGIKLIVIYEFDKSKLSEAYEAIAARCTKYLGVPGLTYSTNIWLEAKEAIKLLGMG